MNKFALFILFLISRACHSQICPLKNGETLFKHFDFITHADPNIAEITSIYSEVYSVSKGKVISIIYLSDIYSIIVKKESEENQYFVYSNLSSTIVKKGDIVNINQLLGNAHEEESKYSIEFQYRILSEKKNPREKLNCKEVNVYY